MSEFSERLKELRKTRKINQVNLGKYLNFGYTAIANYESGRNEPSFDTLIRLAQYFGVTVDYLLGLSDYPQNEKEISEEEEILLFVFRRLDSNEQKILLDIAEALHKK